MVVRRHDHEGVVDTDPDQDEREDLRQRGERYACRRTKAEAETTSSSPSLRAIKKKKQKTRAQRVTIRRRKLRLRAERARERETKDQREVRHFSRRPKPLRKGGNLYLLAKYALARERERFCDWLTKGTVEPIRGQAGSDDKDHAGHPDPAPALDATGAAAAERYRHEHEHDLVCAHTGNG